MSCSCQERGCRNCDRIVRLPILRTCEGFKIAVDSLSFRLSRFSRDFIEVNRSIT